MPKAIPSETIERIRDLYSQGFPMTSIEDAVGVSYPTVKRYTRDLPRQPRQRQRRKRVRVAHPNDVTETEKGRMRELRSQGYMVRDIATLMDRAPATVTRWTAEIREVLSERDIACIRYLRAEGFSVSAIATEFQVASKVVDMYVSDVVVSPTPPQPPRQLPEAVGHAGPFRLDLSCLFCHRSMPSVALRRSPLRERAVKVCKRYVTCECGQTYRIGDLISVDELLFAWREWRGSHIRMPDMTVKSCYVGSQ